MTRPSWDPFDPGNLPELSAQTEGRGNLVVVVSTPSIRDAKWAVGAAVAVADGFSEEGRKVTVVDADLDLPSLHELMDADVGEGVVDLVDFGASANRVVRDAPGARYSFISTGSYAVDPEKVLESEIWRIFCEERVAAGHTIVVHITSGVPGIRAVLGPATDVVVLTSDGRDDEHLDSLLVGCESLVRGVYGPHTGARSAPVDTGVGEAGSETDLRDSEPAPASEIHPIDGSGTSSGGPTTSEGPPARDPELMRSGPAQREPAKAEGKRRAGVDSSFTDGSSSGRRWIWIGGLAAAVAGIALWQTGVIDLPRSSSVDPESEVVPESAPDAAPGEAEVDPVSSRPPPPEPEVIVPGPSPLFQGLAETSGALTYGAQEAAYQTWDDALDGLGDLEARGLPGLIVPVVVDGTTYFRLLVGPFSDAAAAGGVSSGRLDRNLRLAFHLGESADADLVDARMAELLDLRVPTYPVTVEFENGVVATRIYAGAFSSQAEAALVAGILSEAGLGEAPLVSITGVSRGR